MHHSLSLLAKVLIFSTTAIGQVPQLTSDHTATHGTVIFQRNEPSEEAPKKANTPTSQQQLTVTDAERTSLTFTAYDLDVHLVPEKSRLDVHAVFTIRNSGTLPLARLAFQISSQLHWERFTLRNVERLQSLSFQEHLIDSDADHTGQAREAVVSLPQTLASGSSIELLVFYAGEITQSGKRLERIGAPAAQAAQADWDRVTLEETALRGFGNVLWYPTAAAPALLGEGAKLFQAVGQVKLQQSTATVHLRLAVEYIGEAPKAAYFCGRREPLLAVSENMNVPVADAPGIATAEFSSRTMGFRTLSLFVVNVPTLTTSDDLISAATNRDDVLPVLEAAASKIRPLLTEWLGPTQVTTLHILDHEGQPFEDDSMLVTSMRVSDGSRLNPMLVHALSHVWFTSSQQWLDEGIAQFMSLLWTEQNEGHDAAAQQLHEQINALALVEPDLSKGEEAAQAGQSLIGARDDVYYRTKAAAVLWMLRSIVGDEGLKRALQLYRRSGKREEDSREFQRVLELATKKDLRWFFDDWIYRDRGLPDLSIASVTPRELPAQGGKAAGWLIAVEVRNDGDAIADVPVTVRSGTLTASGRVRVAGRSSASTRIVFEGTPDEVVVNDGSVPEVSAMTHKRQLVTR